MFEFPIIPWVWPSEASWKTRPRTFHLKAEVNCGTSTASLLSNSLPAGSQPPCCPTTSLLSHRHTVVPDLPCSPTASRLSLTLTAVKQPHSCPTTSLLSMSLPAVPQPPWCSKVSVLSNSHHVVPQPPCCPTISLLSKSIPAVPQPPCCPTASILSNSLPVVQKLPCCLTAFIFSRSLPAVQHPPCCLTASQLSHNHSVGSQPPCCPTAFLLSPLSRLVQNTWSVWEPQSYRSRPHPPSAALPAHSCLTRPQLLHPLSKYKVVYGQKPPNGESAATVRGVNYQLLALMLLKYPNGQLLVALDRSHLRAKASERVNTIDWPLPHFVYRAVPPERHLHMPWELLHPWPIVCLVFLHAVRRMSWKDGHWIVLFHVIYRSKGGWDLFLKEPTASLRGEPELQPQS